MNYTLTYTGIHLCENCLYQQRCLYSSQSHVTQCEEYEVELKQPVMRIETNTVISSPADVTQQDYKGICTTCDYVKNCSLREKNELILSCEHYK